MSNLGALIQQKVTTLFPVTYILSPEVDPPMFGIPRRYSHFIFAVMQAGLTSLIAAAIASLPLVTVGQFLAHWLLSWFISWITLLPVVVLAAPMIRHVSFRLTNGE
jgi:Protein of unknown function (DUF2798)